MLLYESQMNDYPGARLLYPSPPPANILIADEGCDSDELRQALAAKNIKAGNPPKRNRKIQQDFGTQLYQTHHKVESLLGKLQDWRRISTRYERCAPTFFSVTCIAASFIFYLSQ